MDENRYEANPLRILDCKVDRNHPAMATAPKTLDYLNEHSKAHFEKVCQLLDELEIEYVVDPNLVRGLDYYCHTVFEVISDDPPHHPSRVVVPEIAESGLVSRRIWHIPMRRAEKAESLQCPISSRRDK